MEYLGRTQTDTFRAEVEPVLNQLMELCEKHDINLVAYFDLDRFKPASNFVRAYHVAKPVTAHMSKFMKLFDAIQRELATSPEKVVQARFTRRKKK